MACVLRWYEQELHVQQETEIQIITTSFPIHAWCAFYLADHSLIFLYVFEHLELISTAQITLVVLALQLISLGFGRNYHPPPCTFQCLSIM
jgi:hypothetical protein